MLFINRGLLGGICSAHGSGERKEENLGVREHSWHSSKFPSPLVLALAPRLAVSSYGIRPKTSFELIEASKQQRHDLCRDFTRASAQVTLHTVLIGVGEVIYTPYLKQTRNKDNGRDTRKKSMPAKKLRALRKGPLTSKLASCKSGNV
eukprot:1144077-Pelagomonas_calceolata.AAC.1